MDHIKARDEMENNLFLWDLPTSKDYMHHLLELQHLIYSYYSAKVWDNGDAKEVNQCTTKCSSAV